MCCSAADMLAARLALNVQHVAADTSRDAQADG
jgi:hypothetical protein